MRFAGHLTMRDAVLCWPTMNSIRRFRYSVAIVWFCLVTTLATSAVRGQEGSPTPKPERESENTQSVLENEVLAKIPGDEVQDQMKQTSRSFGRWIDATAEGIVGEWVTRDVAFGITGARLAGAIVLLILTLGVTLVLLSLIRRRAGTIRSAEDRGWIAMVVTAVRKPLAFLLCVYGAYYSFELLIGTLRPVDVRETLSRYSALFTYFGLVVSVFWLLFRLIRGTQTRMEAWAEKSGNRLDNVLVPIVGQALRLVVPFIGLSVLVQALELPANYRWIAGKLLGILLIGGFAYLILRAVKVTEKALLREHRMDVEDNLNARKIYTQVAVVRKIVNVVVITIAGSCMLMMFDSVRQFGTSILASAGIAGIVMGLAAQKTLSNLFAGIQIAFSQPVRIDDVVIVEGEWGRIEEITLTYVVVRIWDLRRLVLPITYFIEKPFQNWTRISADILGSVFLYVDYTIPVDALRKEFQRILEESSLWDRKVCVLQVTDATPQTVEVRCLLSTSDASRGWDLRCEVREKMVAFVQRNYPESLPRVRAEMQPRREVRGSEEVLLPQAQSVSGSAQPGIDAETG